MNPAVFLTAPQIKSLRELSQRWALGTGHDASLVIKPQDDDVLRVECPGAAPTYVHPDGTLASVR